MIKAKKLTKLQWGGIVGLLLLGLGSGFYPALRSDFTLEESLEQESAWVLTQAGALHLREGKAESAIQTYQAILAQGMEDEPSAITALHNLAWIALQSDQAQEAKGFILDLHALGYPRPGLWKAFQEKSREQPTQAMNQAPYDLTEELAGKQRELEEILEMLQGRQQGYLPLQQRAFQLKEDLIRGIKLLEAIREQESRA